MGYYVKLNNGVGYIYDASNKIVSGAVVIQTYFGSVSSHSIHGTTHHINGICSAVIQLADGTQISNVPVS